MMKWGKKKSKSSLPTSPRPSLISSWLLKFKKNNSSAEAKGGAAKKKGKWNSQSVSSLQRGGFDGGDDDAFWRLSFGEERVERRKSRGDVRSIWYDSDDGLETLPTSCRSCGSNAMKVGGREEIWNFSDMVSDVRKMRELCRYAGKDAGLRTPRRVTKEVKLRKANQSFLEEKWSESNEAEDKDILELQRLTKKNEPELTNSNLWKSHVPSVKSRNSSLRPIEEDCVVVALNPKEADEVSAEELRSAWQKSKEMKIKELKSKSEKNRKNLHIDRELQRKAKQGSKVRAYSPRTASKVEICKIKALEDMKKAKLKMKKKERVVEKRTGLDRFALVKCSFDPQQDFRDSMIEMIMEKRINQPEELEELLACYLTLNSDEYHDLIIKVFRQVWFELDQPCFATDLTVDNRRSVIFASPQQYPLLHYNYLCNWKLVPCTRENASPCPGHIHQSSDFWGDIIINLK